MSNITDLSKSRYCKGIQCPKMLWLDAYKPQEAEDILPESVLANGTLVGDLARSYFGEYSLVDFSFDKTEMVNKTNELMQSGAENIAEAFDPGHSCYSSILSACSSSPSDTIESRSTSITVPSTMLSTKAFSSSVDT